MMLESVTITTNGVDYDDDDDFLLCVGREGMVPSSWHRPLVSTMLEVRTTIVVVATTAINGIGKVLVVEREILLLSNHCVPPLDECWTEFRITGNTNRSLIQSCWWRWR
jgi:hypothetical protein